MTVSYKHLNQIIIGKNCCSSKSVFKLSYIQGVEMLSSCFALIGQISKLMCMEAMTSISLNVVQQSLDVEGLVLNLGEDQLS